MKAKNGFYIRPLLWSNRNQIENYAKANEIQWVEDYTNNEKMSISYLSVDLTNSVTESDDNLT